MKLNLSMAVGLVCAVAPLGAQTLATSSCPGTTQAEVVAQNACQQAYDVFQYLVPQIALALSGGNATLGQNSTLGGFGTFSVGVHAAGFSGSVPSPSSFPQATGAPTRNTLSSSSKAIAIPAFDASIGVFGGIPLALTNVGGVDLIASAAVVPNINVGDIVIPPHTSYQVGYGIRVGLLSESLLIPGLSVTYSQRDLPSISMSSVVGSTSLVISDMEIHTHSWRVVGSKSLLIADVAVGGGVDNYDQGADIHATVVNGAGTVIGTGVPRGTTQTHSRSNYFANVGVNLLLFRVIGEVGHVSAMDDVQTFNAFSGGAPGRQLTYGSLGVRIGK